ncbi:MAG: formate dehydrogenase subunit alpha [Acidobacteriota bacterium]
MKPVSISIDDQNFTVPSNTTVLEACRMSGRDIPTLCDDPDLRPYGACRLCIVQIEGVRGLPTSCTTPVRPGMVIKTNSEEINRVRRSIVEMMISRHPEDCLICEASDACQLLKLARRLNVQKTTIDRLRRRSRMRNPVDSSHPALLFDSDKCVLCGKCVRTCHEIAGIGAIDFAFRGDRSRISPFGAKPLAESICRSCGECTDRCPTGALRPAQFKSPEKEIRTLCPYCGVGCGLVLGIQDRQIVRVRGDESSPVNRGELCVKGRFGVDYVHHPDRLRKPLIRKNGFSKTEILKNPMDAFREAGWDEALNLVAGGFRNILSRYTAKAVGVISSAKCTNEDNYIVQKFARAVLGTNNVDHCARLCHASTVSAALESFGSGAMSNSIDDVDYADVVLVIGSNTTDCHPILGRKIMKAVKRGELELIVADPRSIDLAEMARVHLAHLPGTDVALLHGMMRHIIEKGLHDEVFIRERCEGYEAFLNSLEQYPLSSVSGITGVPQEKIREAAELFGNAPRGMVLYGMGITQHISGTDNVKAVANLLLLTGNIGRRGTGFSPLRGQNNVQGSCDMGALPNVFPGYQSVSDPEARKKFEEEWERPLNPAPGFTLTEMFQKIHEKKLRAMYVVGENPALSEPDVRHARDGLARLDFLAVQDLFLTETAQMADVVLPAASFAEKNGTFTNTERRVQRVRKAFEPPGEAAADWRILAKISTRMGYVMKYRSTDEIMNEIARLTPSYGGIRFSRLENGGIQWPCPNPDHPGTATLYSNTFTRGRGLFHALDNVPPAELPTMEFPLLLNTGRILEQWHTGSMSRRSRVLNALAPEGHVEINPDDAARLGLENGDTVNLSSRRGRIQTKVSKTERVSHGQAFMAFHWNDAPANVLTNPALDPVAKIPEYKISSIKAVLDVLERAATDNSFLAALASNPAGMLSKFELTEEHRKALSAGDITKIEQWVGPLDPRLRDWLKDRLMQEDWK